MCLCVCLLPHSAAACMHLDESQVSLILWTSYADLNSAPVLCTLYFYSIAGIVPGVVSDVALTSIPSTTQPICPGKTIEFTCTTTGSSILLWTSDDYIGVNSHFGFRSIDSIGTTRNTIANADTIAIANLTAIDGGILTSTLRIVATPVPTIRSSTITCINSGLGTINTSTVQVAGM